MLSIFKQDKENGAMDVKAVRDKLLQFIKEQLSKVEGGEGRGIKALLLFIASDDAEKHLYESAVYFDEENGFKNEVQKIADDFAINLPDNWAMEISFVETVPAEAIKVPELSAALFIQTRKRVLHKFSEAVIKILNGEAEKEEYNITSTGGIISIGRENKVQTPDGFFRINQIAFPSSSSNESNKFVSRQHAHISYDEETGCFLLFADDGGVPPRNKIKVRSSNGDVFKLQSTEVGHQLQDNDQIVLGDSAVLLFNYKKSES